MFRGEKIENVDHLECDEKHQEQEINDIPKVGHIYFERGNIPEVSKLMHL
jgi:hypothetical protein